MAIGAVSWTGSSNKQIKGREGGGVPGRWPGWMRWFLCIGTAPTKGTAINGPSSAKTTKTPVAGDGQTRERYVCQAGGWLCRVSSAPLPRVDDDGDALAKLWWRCHLACQSDAMTFLGQSEANSSANTYTVVSARGDLDLARRSAALRQGLLYSPLSAGSAWRLAVTGGLCRFFIFSSLGTVDSSSCSLPLVAAVV